ncbi:MAG: DUF4012 domain-containing protein [Anaerolineae bacterium]|nr:DUF4012 domain-containing protein [Anaerolineae bacterium]
MTRLGDSLGQAANQFDILNRETELFWPLLERSGWVPVYGGDLKAAPRLLATGRQLSHSLVILAEVLNDSRQTLKKPDWLSSLVATLNDSHADMDRALILLQQSQANLDGVPVETLTPAVAERVQLLQRFLPPMTTGAALAARLPALLGIESPQTYLILSPNSDELRPAGGFITLAGHITFDRGRITDFKLYNSSHVDEETENHPYPPAPMYYYMKAGYWLMRDVTWSPDFPAVADTAVDLYELGQGIQADGVVSLDQHGLVQLLRAFKPLSVNGEQVTSDNVIKLMRWHWSPNAWQGARGDWSQQRKAFLVELSETIRQTIEQQPSTIKLPILAEMIEQALAEKHLLVYMKDPVLQSHIVDKNWGGAINSGNGDYLMIADANVGFNKASALVQRGLIYHITLATDGSAKAQAHLTYEHHGRPHSTPCSILPRSDPVYEDNMQRCYWNYMRLVTPAAAHLISGPGKVVEGKYLLHGETTTGEPDVELLLDKQSWGQLFMLTPDQTTLLDFEYELPAGTARKIDESLWQYTLYLQKQPGTLTTDTQVTVALPSGAQLTQSQPPATLDQNGALTFSTNQKTDWQLLLYYKLPQKE